jgi:non-specific serine/threonine protein kinase
MKLNGASQQKLHQGTKAGNQICVSKNKLHLHLALPHLLKYVYTHGTDEVIRRGKKIHAIGFVELIEHDHLFGSAAFRVKDDSYATFYKVNVQNYKDIKGLSMRCSCPYNLGEICRHEAAALLRLQEMIDKGLLLVGDVEYDQRHTVAKMKAIEIKSIRLLCSPEVYDEAERYLQTNKPVIESARDEVVKAKVKIDGEEYFVIIRRNEERTFDTSSNYVDTTHPLCLPKVIVFQFLFHKYGIGYFDTIRNWDKEKNKLLEAYGYSLNDDLKGKFEFSYKEGKPFLRVLDPSIKRIAAPTSLLYKKAEEPIEVADEVATKEPVIASRRLAAVFNFNKTVFPYFTIDLIEGEMAEGNSFTGMVEKLELQKYIDLESYEEKEKSLITQLRKLQDTEINKYINRNSPFSGFWENIVHNEGEELPEETKSLIANIFCPS